MRQKAPIGNGEPPNYTAAEVTALRDARNWSTYDLAKYLGCNQSTVWRIENESGYLVSPAHRRLLALLPPASFIVTRTPDGTVVAFDPTTGVTASALTSDDATTELRRRLDARQAA